ncbi:SGNH/GDSL hydrolase family protein [Gracilibacillus dipsosauri]|uniref:SGNH hydrolase-type esterase domain-containing protein n=1 Tax=Gracilibacillus dipsosauri TaxID=178340 RepID=A0A317KZG8_9BACI|nr:SGNH/GDSL hydrolase family protein [Gracilibacillus dipsosauri]PWU67049.1 hypothetical protein DLJ74_17670 [Gracilibacillus dipsosauri]
MKKRILLGLSITIMIGLIIAFIFIIDKEKDVILQDGTTQEDQADTEPEDAVEAESPEETSVPKEIRDRVKDVVIDAIQFFKKDTDIVAIGDSLTQGVGDETENGGYVGIIEERLDNQEVKVTIDNFGKRGNRTDQLLQRLQEEDEVIDSIKGADMVLITIGANDVMKILKDNFMNLTMEPFNEEKEPYGDRLEQILKRIKALQPNAKIYLLGLFNPFEKYFSDIKALDQIMTQWNTESKQVVSQFEQATFIPMQDIYQGRSQNLLAEDNFHPNTRGYQLIANRVLSYLKSDLEDSANN